MKVEKGMTDVLGFPIEETEKVIEAMEQAEKAGDLPALKWCARGLQFLYKAADVIGGDDEFYPERLFNRDWNARLKTDPPPESVAAIINREDEPEAVTAADAESALNTVKAFFEENIAKKKTDRCPSVAGCAESRR